MLPLVRIINQTSFPIASDSYQLVSNYLEQDDFELLFAQTITEKVSIESERQFLDLLYVPKDCSLDLEIGKQFATYTQGTQVGLLVEGLGIKVMQGGKLALKRFFSDRKLRQDIHVYEKSGDCRQKWEIEVDKPVSLPKQVYLGLTQKCNRSCSFCVSRTFTPAILPLDAVRQLAEQLKNEVKIIALTGAGESLIHPDFWSVVDVLKEIIPDIQFKMNTSGITLPKVAERIVQEPFQNVTISLNAATQETYERFVGKGFELVLDGIRSLVAARAATPRCTDLQITLSMVLMNSTIQELPSFVSKAFELGVEEIQGIYLMIYDKKLAHESPWHQPERSNAFLAQASERAARIGISARLPSRFKERETAAGSLQLSSLPTSQGQACIEPWGTIYLRPNGDIISCPYVEKSLGNIFKTKFEKIWNGQEYTELRKSLVTGNYWDMCRHCCGFNETGSVDDYRSHWLGDLKPS